MTHSPPLIIGAGPVGMAAAALLSRYDIVPRIVDKRAEPSRYSKALAINPRTLELLEKSGLTDKLLALGRKIHGATIHRNGRVIAEIDFEEIEHRFPFMLALSQASTERVLREDLAERGIEIERSLELVESPNLAEGQANLVHVETQANETIEAPWILATDGAHSIARKSVHVPFPGDTYDRAWVLDDIPLATDFAPDRAHIKLQDDGFLFMLPVFTGEEKPGEPTVWRVIGNYPEPLSQLTESTPVGESLWNSSFHIAHRLVESMNVGKVYFAGDAAHLHSPVGARGMNLGIEDAWVFAELAKRDELALYHQQRWPIDNAIVSRIRTITGYVKAESFIKRTLRNLLAPKMLRWKSVRETMLKTVSGLDHPVPLLHSEPEESPPQESRSARRRDGKRGKR
ncbi:FAD-dependent monooxygenase [Bremerella sp. TYQ1]|uniref:FAD-dependent monooxygenase n=1 Tax=Bremerella sp. TYQ1 TaxID=3119568 RepID=UPI001CD03396|nr:FAD-dependent monooxygenase [Bremerella volcania]UBM33899.1 FAD-dependent monooxygenase [Bremerella volcania]